MMTNKDIDEMIVRAEMDVDDAIEEALAEFYRPDVEMEAAMLWADLPETVRKLVKKKAPDAVKRIEELMK